MRGWRWFGVVVLVGWCLVLAGCSSPTTSSTKPASTDKEPPKKPTGEVG